MSGSDVQATVTAPWARRRHSAPRWTAVLLAPMATIALASCGGSGGGSNSNANANAGQPVNGGTLRAAMVSNPDHLDPALAYSTETWEMLSATNDGLVTFKRASGNAGNEIVPDLATAMPTVTDGGTTYTFHVHTGVKFSPPQNRAVEPSDIKFSIERLFRVNSPGVGFYTDIKGASQYEKTKKGGISGIVANNKTHTIAFHLVQRDGTFLEYLAMPFADAVPAGTPDKDVSTDPRWRIATGPYMFKSYTPQGAITLVRNPNFHQWTPNIPNGHLDGIHVTIGTSPDQAVNEIADGDLDYYFEAVAPDRLAAISKQYPSQVHTYTRNALLYFTLNGRKPPMNNVKVRQAINYAIDRPALVKIFGGQGTPTENLIPSGMTAYKAHNFYPYNLAKAKSLVDSSGTKGMAVQVWASSTDPQPEAAQYMASVLNSLGYHATVKTMSEGIYYDTVANEATDPQVSYNEWDEDFPEAEDYVDAQFNGRYITKIGTNDNSNLNVPSLNQQMNKVREMGIGPAREAQWAKLDAEIMKTQAPVVPFMNRNFPKFYSSRLHGLVFNATFYELFPSMWLSK
jgi:peptide/nickel transport system substrate-binding protein